MRWCSFCANAIKETEGKRWFAWLRQGCDGDTKNAERDDRERPGEALKLEDSSTLELGSNGVEIEGIALAFRLPAYSW